MAIYNKLDINSLCPNCRKKITEFRGFTIDELYDAFYNDPKLAHLKNDHKMLNSIIYNALIAKHDCTRCPSKIMN